MTLATTTSDAFNAVADSCRHAILSCLARSEWPVGEIVESLGLKQPAISKHLRVLFEVGVIHVRRHGRRMVYRTNAEAIEPFHEWTGTFERFWRRQLDRVKERAEGKVNRGDSEPNSRRNHDFDDGND